MRDSSNQSVEDVRQSRGQQEGDQINEAEQGEDEESIEVLDISPLKKATHLPSPVLEIIQQTPLFTACISSLCTVT